MSTGVSIRPARALDVHAAAPLLYSSGPAAFDYVFAQRSTRAEDFLRRAFVDGAGEFGHRIHVVAELNGEVVGVGAGFDGSTGLDFMGAAIRQIMACYGPVSGAGVIARGLSAETVIPPPAKGVLCVAHLGVAPELRGRGVGNKIIAHLLEAAAARGFHRAALDVSAENPRAQALYERLGFAVTRERKSTLRNRWAEVPDHRHMERSL